jgi:hypothetical protein
VDLICLGFAVIANGVQGSRQQIVGCRTHEQIEVPNGGKFAKCRRRLAVLCKQTLQDVMDWPAQVPYAGAGGGERTHGIVPFVMFPQGLPLTADIR